MSDYPVTAEVREDLDIPKTRRGRPPGATRWSVVTELDVGQSAVFTIPTEEELKRFRNTLSSTVYRYGKRLNRKFTVRTLEPSPEGLRIGVWRLEDPDPDVEKIQ